MQSLRMPLIIRMPKRNKFKWLKRAINKYRLINSYREILKMKYSKEIKGVSNLIKSLMMNRKGRKEISNNDRRQQI